MSAEDDFRAVLVAYAPLTALVPATAISQNAAEPDLNPPYVVYTSEHTPTHGLANNVLATEVTFSVNCWGTTAAQADAVADEAQAGLLAAGVVCTARSTALDPQLGLDATILTAQWWDD